MAGYPRLEADPLVLVLAQVRFAPILTIEEVIPAIQARLKTSGFPRFKQVVGRKLVLTAAPQVLPIQEWVFADRDRKTAVVVAQDFVVLETSNYDVYDEFSSQLRHAVSIVGEEAGTELVERLGLRYVDLIRPIESGGEMAEYLRPGLQGPDLSDLNIAEGAYRIESRNVTEDGNAIVIKLSHRSDGTFLPGDMDGQHLKFDVQLAPDEHIALLDIDHFNEEPRDYDTAQILDRMDLLHSRIKDTFVRCVTRRALEHWKMQGDWSIPE